MYFWQRDRRTNLEKEIDSVLLAMKKTNKTSSEYATMVKNLGELYKARATCTEPRKKISADTVLIVGGNLLGIGFVLGFERLNAITSKAFQMILKGRV